MTTDKVVSLLFLSKDLSFGWFGIIIKLYD